MNYVVEQFHGRSLALSHSQEEIEELDLQTNDETLTEQKLVEFIRTVSFILFDMFFFSFKRKFTRQGTYRVRKRRHTPSILPQDEIIQNLTESTVNKQKLIEEAKRKVKEAESTAQDLSLNIQ